MLLAIKNPACQRLDGGGLVALRLVVGNKFEIHDNSPSDGGRQPPAKPQNRLSRIEDASCPQIFVLPTTRGQPEGGICSRLCGQIRPAEPGSAGFLPAAPQSRIPPAENLF